MIAEVLGEFGVSEKIPENDVTWHSLIVLTVEGFSITRTMSKIRHCDITTLFRISFETKKYQDLIRLLSPMEMIRISFICFLFYFFRVVNSPREGVLPVSMERLSERRSEPAVAHHLSLVEGDPD